MEALFDDKQIIHCGQELMKQLWSDQVMKK